MIIRFDGQHPRQGGSIPVGLVGDVRIPQLSIDPGRRDMAVLKNSMMKVTSRMDTRDSTRVSPRF